jgi:transposase
MMGKRDLAKRVKNKRTNLENMVPRNHIIRKIDKAINLNFIYDDVQHLYASCGKTSIDPVVLFKIVIIQYLFGIRSMRQTIKEIQVNAAYRWYLGYAFDEPIPHFSTFGKNYSRRFEGTDIFEKIFQRILNEAINSDFVDTSDVFIDGTHVKANANLHLSKKTLVIKTSKAYNDLLQKEISEDRIAHGKKY